MKRCVNCGRLIPFWRKEEKVYLVDPKHIKGNIVEHILNFCSIKCLVDYKTKYSRPILKEIMKKENKFKVLWKDKTRYIITTDMTKEELREVLIKGARIYKIK